jgi:beta-phosphoglucomutase-like phosphatase (HAD superfamily)
MKNNKEMQLFLDCDGVLADFVRGATKLLGMPPDEFEARFGEAEMWKRIEQKHDFFGSLEPMPDAFELFNAVKHLNPIILTGRPRGKWATEQKLKFRDKYFPDTEMIVCLSRDKIKYAKPGDVIVDDFMKWRHLWEKGGGLWVLHTSAATSIQELKELGVL